MDDEILTIYCLCDDLLHAVGHRDDARCQMSSAEVMTVAIVAASCFGGNFALASRWLHFDFDLPDRARIIADKAYNVYWFEDLLAEAGLHLLPIRRKNSKLPHEPWQRGLQWLCRQVVETAGS